MLIFLISFTKNLVIGNYRVFIVNFTVRHHYFETYRVDILDSEQTFL